MNRDPENGMFIGPDGAHYDTEWEAHWMGTLGMCGCGNPEGGYNFIRRALQLMDRRDTSKSWVNAQEELARLVAAEPETVAHILLHVLADKKVTEHGSSVGGSWLTPVGMEIVDGESP